MALDIQPPNLSGLTSLAGRTSNLNLTPTGALGLQALQQRQAQEAMMKKDALERMQLQQQGQIALGQQGIQRQAASAAARQAERQGLFQDRELALKQQQLGIQGGQFQDELALKQQQLGQQGALAQGELDVKKMAIFQKKQQEAMKGLLAEKKETLQKKGAYMSYSLMSLNDAKSPEQAQQISDAISRDAVKNGYMSQEESDQMSKLPLSQRKNILKSQIMSLGMAAEYKSMQPDESKEKSTVNKITRTNPDGTVSVEEYSPLTTAGKTDAHKKLTGAESNLKELNAMLTNVPDDYFGAAALGQTATYLGELGEKIPGIGPLIEPSKEDKESSKMYNSMQSRVRKLSMDIIKDLSGLSYTDKQLDFMNDIVPQIGPTATRSQFEGRAQYLQEFFGRVKEVNEEVLAKGVALGSEEHKQAVLDKLKEVSTSFNTETKRSPAAESLYKFMKERNATEEEIQTEIKNRKL